jgi:hypothetical protein
VIATAPTPNAEIGAREANGMLEIARVAVPA